VFLPPQPQKRLRFFAASPPKKGGELLNVCSWVVFFGDWVYEVKPFTAPPVQECDAMPADGSAVAGDPKIKN
jgi:hypothetical protein